MGKNAGERRKPASFIDLVFAAPESSHLSFLEYKGPTVSGRLEHLDLLIELGLGMP